MITKVIYLQSNIVKTLFPKSNSDGMRKNLYLWDLDNETKCLNSYEGIKRSYKLKGILGVDNSYYITFLMCSNKESNSWSSISMGKKIKWKTYRANSSRSFQLAVNFILMSKLRTNMFFFLKFSCHLIQHRKRKIQTHVTIWYQKKNFNKVKNMLKIASLIFYNGRIQNLNPSNLAHTSVPFGPWHKYISPKLPPPMRRTIWNLSAITLLTNSDILWQFLLFIISKDYWYCKENIFP